MPSKQVGPVANFQLTLKKYESEIARALPKHIDVNRMLTLAVTSVKKNPKLLNCTPSSLFGAIIQSTQLGLEPDGALGQGFLIPYGNDVQFQIGYQGLIELARRSGELASINANCVYKDDRFEFEYGMNETLKHTPNAENLDDKNIIYAYAYAKLKDGSFHFTVMTKSQVDKIRSKSPGRNKGPWVDHYAEMAKKTALKRMLKLLPKSVEFSRGLEYDHNADNGQVMDVSNIDTDTGELMPSSPEVAPDMKQIEEPKPKKRENTKLKKPKVVPVAKQTPQAQPNEEPHAEAPPLLNNNTQADDVEFEDVDFNDAF